ncbi:MAG TPA: radical SAM protein [Candidatus Tectomicrobia bacterium]|nr:radical SAM protein [Candidatus Tectomicrobia bacterium]
MDTRKEALFYETMADGRVHCRLCPHACKIGEGKRGVCGVRINSQGILYTLVYDKVVSRHVDPIEKKPLFHFQPGSTSYSIATVGCNMRCAFCQNWELSQLSKGRIPERKADNPEAPEPICPPLEAAAQRIIGEQITPQQIVDAAMRVGAHSIAYTYTEPTIFYELAYDTAVLARDRGLKNIFVTNGFIAEEALRQIATVFDAANVDLKFFKDENYRRISGARLQPILEAIRRYKALGVWVEVTTLIIPGVNDSDEELRQIAAFVQSVGPDVPWHVTQFYPAYKMLDRRPTPLSPGQGGTRGSLSPSDRAHRCVTRAAAREAEGCRSASQHGHQGYGIRPTGMRDKATSLVVSCMIRCTFRSSKAPTTTVPRFNDTACS